MAESSPLAHSPTLVAATSRVAGDGDVLAPGAVAGEYVVDRFLGAGAMGDVYAGHHPVIGKKVAIKVLKHEAAASPDAAERFIREARAVNQVDHPNVIDVFAFGRLPDGDGRLYLVMDLVEGKSLRKALVDGPLDVETALYVLGEVALALDAAHARGVVHRDLKPDNVMLGTQTPPKVFVLDFGLAKLVSVTDAPLEGAPLTGKGTWLGTPGYMAPEQWSADGAGPASDRYSLGVMAFELLSGQLPFQAGSLPQMMEQHFRTPVPALSTRGAIATHAAFDPVITRAMAKDPDKRFASGREMVEALRAAAGSRRTRGSATAGRRQWVPIVAGAGVLGLSFAAYLAVRSKPVTDRGAAAATRTDEPGVGLTRVEVISVPDKAQVWRDGRLLGTTTLAIDARPDEELVLDVRKPGYAPAHYIRRAGDPTTPPVFELASVNGFEGVWELPNHELRAFQRVGDRVDVFKLETIEGERAFFRHFELVPAEDGVAFATTEEVVDPRGPNDPGCHIPHHVEYHYDPEPDALVVQPEHVEISFRDGHCVIVSRDPGVALTLTRVDRERTDVHRSDAPIGVPPKPKQAPTKVRGKVSSVAPSKPPPKPPSAVVNDSLDNAFDRGQKDANQAPPNLSTQAAPKGDSQVAPQIAPGAQQQQQQQQQIQKK